MTAADYRKRTAIEWGLSILLCATGILGFVWTMRQPVGSLPQVWALFWAITLWIPMWAVIAYAPAWMTRWVNHQNPGNPRFRLFRAPGNVPVKGTYLAIAIDPREPIARETILSGARRICSSPSVIASTSATVLLTGWLILRQPWMLATACALGIVLAWELHPGSNGIRYHTGILESDCLVRSLCLNALANAFEEETSIQEWHRDYFDLILTPSDGSPEDFSAASWNFMRALLLDELENASRYVERQLSLLPENLPATEYLALGRAVHFYAVVAPSRSKAEALVQRIKNLAWNFPQPEHYIEAAIAIVEGRLADARSIAQACLKRIGPSGGNARIQLVRQLLIQCSDYAA